MSAVGCGKSWSSKRCVQTNGVYCEIANNNTHPHTQLTPDIERTCQYANWKFFAITLMGEANLEFQFRKCSVLQWTGLRMAKRGRDRNRNNVPYC